MNKLTIGYAGMTHLGLNYAIAGAGKDFNIIGFDPNAVIVTMLNAGELPIIEPGLQEALLQHQDNLEFTNQIQRLSACDIVYIAPDVSTDANGQSDLTYITQLIEQVIPALNDQSLLVILAQVPPGFTRLIKLPTHRLYYQVETLVFGQAVARAAQPERFIVGSATPDEPINAKLAEYLQAFSCPILPMRYESAELAKIAINCCLIASISVANSLAEICEKIGANWSEIVPALKLDKRIGPSAYLQPGLGLAGGNLERDLATVVKLAEQHGTDKNVIQALQQNSEHRRNWPLKTLHTVLLGKNPHAKIAVLGLTYKENTHSLKNSPAIKLLHDISSFDVVAFDPVIKQLDAGFRARIAPSVLDAANDADAVIIMTPWEEFKNLDLKQLAHIMRQKIIIDPFKVIDHTLLDAADFSYYTLGK